MKKFSLLLLLVFLPLLSLRAQDADSLKFPPVSLGVLLQNSLSGEHMHVQETYLSTNAGLGVEIGGFIDYNITPQLSFELQLILALQGLGHITREKDEMVTLFGMDIPLYFVAAFPIQKNRLRFGIGPFAHVTFDAWNSSDRTLVTPYRQVISVDDIKGKPRYALNNYYGGIALLAGWEFAIGLQINLGASYSVMDILNYEHAYNSFDHPYKITLGLGWRF